MERQTKGSRRGAQPVPGLPEVATRPFFFLGGGERFTYPTMVPFRVHVRRPGMSEAYHRRVQKKWVKRWGELPHYGSSSGEKYILMGREVRPARDLWTWANWMTRDRSRRVALTRVGPLSISTVFLGLDHGFGFSEVRKPVVFETMAFGPDGIEDGYTERYCTMDEAELGHVALVETLKIKLAVEQGCTPIVAHVHAPKNHTQVPRKD